MIPLKDTIPSRHRPIMTWVLILVNLLIFIYQFRLLRLNPGIYHHFIGSFGLVPANFKRLEPGQILLLYPFLTYIFLHGGWMHLISNMWALWLFGDNIEDRMGPVRFLLFYLVCGVIAGIVHFMTSQGSSIATIGASGAIAAVMGAYFILYPTSRIITLVPIFIIPFFFEIPAVIYLAFWLITQVYSVLLSQQGEAVANVAWWAHIGGFIAGIILHRLFFSLRRREKYYY